MRLLKLIIAAIVIASGLCASAGNITPTEGEVFVPTIDGIYYELYSNTHLGKVTGAKKSGDIVIPATVSYLNETYDITAIKENAFNGFKNIGTVTIQGNNLLEIGPSAFAASSITSIAMPNSVTTLGRKAFSSCEKLTSVQLSSGLTEIPEMAFHECTSLSSLTIPEGVTTLGNNALMKCNSLKSIQLPSTLTTMNQAAIMGCPMLTSIELPKSLRTIGVNTFSYCGFTYLNIPEGVTTIGQSVGDYCEKLVAVSVPSTAKVIDGMLFDASSVVRLYSRATKPVEASDETFYTPSLNSKTVLYVPKGTVSAYRDTAPWLFFNTIKEEVVGDADGNQTVDVSDVSAVINHVLGKGSALTAIPADVDKDGCIDVLDVNSVINIILNK